MEVVERKYEDHLYEESPSSSRQLVVVACPFLCYSFFGPLNGNSLQLWCVAASIDGVFWREQGKVRLVETRRRLLCIVTLSCMTLADITDPSLVARFPYIMEPGHMVNPFAKETNK